MLGGSYPVIDWVARRNVLITCSFCNKSYHVKCCSLKTNDFIELCEKNLDWHCNSCMDTIFPFSCIKTTGELLDIFKGNDSNNPTPRSKKTKCNFCSENIKINMPASLCSVCNCFQHLGCSNMTNRNFPLPKDWLCPLCVTKTLPFSNIDDEAMKLTLYGFNQDDIESLTKKAPSFSIKSLLNKMPGQHFSTDEFLDQSIQSKYYSTADFITTNFNAKRILFPTLISLQFKGT